jgi:hypothetical protein
MEQKYAWQMKSLYLIYIDGGNRNQINEKQGLSDALYYIGKYGHRNKKEHKSRQSFHESH